MRNPFRRAPREPEPLDKLRRAMEHWPIATLSLKLRPMEDFIVIPAAARTLDGLVGIQVLVDPPLADAPPGTIEYIGAYLGIAYGLNLYPYPTRAGMRVIRSVLAEFDEYPFRGTPVQAYSRLARDRAVRELTDLRITPEMAEWADRHERPSVDPTWRGRLAVQEADARVWP